MSAFRTADDADGDDSTQVAWTIAGIDGSGGAGLQADLRTFEALGLHGAAVVTTVTAQSLDRAAMMRPLAAADVATQLRVLAADMPPRAIKIGMLGSAAIVRVVARHLAQRPAGSCGVVLDPVLATSSGLSLASDAARRALRGELLPLVDLVTPNVPELERLLDLTPGALRTAGDLADAAAALRALGAKAVLVKGGHCVLQDTLSIDYYCGQDGRHWLCGPHLPVKARGTGCTLAAAIAAGLARGLPLRDALVCGRAYLTRALRQARSVTDGSPRVLRAAPWPVDAVDMPWVLPVAAAAVPAAVLAAARPGPFAATGPQPLGFYPIVPRSAWIERLVPLGVTTIQLRIKDLAGEELAREVETASRYCRAAGCRLFVNDYWPLALRFGAYGVHLGQEDLAGADLAAMARAGLRLGVSTHDHHEAAVARALRPSYVALGPIFPTTCKSMRFGPQGLARLREWRALTDAARPLVAIGGLKLAHAADVVAAGAAGVAVISDVTEAARPEAQVVAWLRRLAPTGPPVTPPGVFPERCAGVPT